MPGERGVESKEAVRSSTTTLRFVIAHRLSTVRDADRIVVMDRCRMVEEGTHDEPLARRSRYWYLAGQQLDG